MSTAEAASTVEKNQSDSANRKAEVPMQAESPAVSCREFRADDAAAFRSLNEEWIEHHFRLEEKDRLTLGDPEGQILGKGGHIFVAEQGDDCIACVALLHYGDGDYELSKMAVAPALRSRGVGRKLLQHALDRAHALGARRVFLGSNSVLANAVRLYESLGFQHVPPSVLPHLGYVRADVYMAISLKDSAVSAD